MPCPPGAQSRRSHHGRRCRHLAVAVSAPGARPPRRDTTTARVHRRRRDGPLRRRWTVYHGDPAGSGVAAGGLLSQPLVHGVDVAGARRPLYGEPLVSGGEVFVATENDTVYALSTTNGAVVWSTHVGTPVPASDRSVR